MNDDTFVCVTNMKKCVFIKQMKHKIQYKMWNVCLYFFAVDDKYYVECMRMWMCVCVQHYRHVVVIDNVYVCDEPHTLPFTLVADHLRQNLEPLPWRPLRCDSPRIAMSNKFMIRKKDILRGRRGSANARARSLALVKCGGIIAHYSASSQTHPISKFNTIKLVRFLQQFRPESGGDKLCIVSQFVNHFWCVRRYKSIHIVRVNHYTQRKYLPATAFRCCGSRAWSISSKR